MSGTTAPTALIDLAHVRTMSSTVSRGHDRAFAVAMAEWMPVLMAPLGTSAPTTPFADFAIHGTLLFIAGLRLAHVNRVARMRIGVPCGPLAPAQSIVAETTWQLVPRRARTRLVPRTASTGPAGQRARAP